MIEQAGWLCAGLLSATLLIREANHRLRWRSTSITLQNYRDEWRRSRDLIMKQAVAIAQWKYALVRARRLVIRHHDCGVMSKLEWGGICPVCGENNEKEYNETFRLLFQAEQQTKGK